MSVELSKGALDAIMRGEDYVEPVVQIITTKKMNAGTGQPDKDRYRVFLSDGQTSLSFAMMTASTYNKAGDKGLPRFTIIKVVKYITSVINNTEGKDNRVLLIVDLEVLKDGDEVGEKLGDPVPFTEGGSASTRKTEPPKPVQSTSDERPSKMPRLVNQPNVSQQNQDTQWNAGREMTHPISSLSPYQNKWVIKARVVSKSDIRTWSNSKGNGQLFSMDLADESGEIRCTGFKEMVDKYYNIIQVDKVYYISKCMLKPANKQFNTTNNDYEMTMTSETIIEECLEDNLPQVQTHFNFIPIGKIAQVEPNEFVDIIGVAVSVGDVQTFTARTTGRELKKREIQLLDQSGATVTLTLWGSQAESFDRTDNPVIALKGARVSEFGGGKTVTTVARTVLKIDPDIKEAYQLQGWYNQEGSNIKATDLSARIGAVSGGGNAPWMCLKQVVDQRLGTTDMVKGDFFQTKATVLMFRTDNAIYKACPSPECNKKVIDQDGSYRCEKCQKDFETFKYRLMCSMNIGDWSGNQWVSMFNDEAEKVLGMTADEAGKLQEDDQSSYREALQRCHFQEYILRCRAKMDTYRDEERLKIVAVRASPVNLEEFNSYLIRNIKQFVQSEN